MMRFDGENFSAAVQRQDISLLRVDTAKAAAFPSTIISAEWRRA
jgi:hypothetical protein